MTNGMGWKAEEGGRHQLAIARIIVGEMISNTAVGFHLQFFTEQSLKSHEWGKVWILNRGMEIGSTIPPLINLYLVF